MRTQFLSTAILLLRLGCGATPEPAPQPPNIVWLIAADVSPDLGAYGKPVRMPNLDRLAAEGIREPRDILGET